MLSWLVHGQLTSKMMFFLFSSRNDVFHDSCKKFSSLSLRNLNSWLEICISGVFTGKPHVGQQRPIGLLNFGKRDQYLMPLCFPPKCWSFGIFLHRKRSGNLHQGGGFSKICLADCKKKQMTGFFWTKNLCFFSKKAGKKKFNWPMGRYL